MTLPASGAISLSQVNTELGLSSTAPITLNDAAVRALFAKPSGIISLADGYSKSAVAPWDVQATQLPDAYGTAGYASPKSIVWTGTRYVIVGSYGEIYYSTTGTSWTTITTVFYAKGAQQSFHDIRKAGSYLAVVGQYSNLISPFYSSNDGVSWTKGTNLTGSYTYGNTYSLATTGSNFLQVLQHGVYRSANGASWTASAALNYVNSVTSSGSLHVINIYPYGIKTSTDMINWTAQADCPVFPTLGNLIYLNGYFITLGYSPAVSNYAVAWSTNGVSWSTATVPILASARGIAWNGSYYLAYGINGFLAKSTDLTNWTQVAWLSAAPSWTTAEIRGVVWANSKWLAVGENGKVATSVTGSQ